MKPIKLSLSGKEENFAKVTNPLPSLGLPYARLEIGLMNFVFNKIRQRIWEQVYF
jgi:hypothetical protein